MLRTEEVMNNGVRGLSHPARLGGCPCPLAGASSLATSLSLSFLNSTPQDFVPLWPPFSRLCRRAQPFPDGPDREAEASVFFDGPLTCSYFCSLVIGRQSQPQDTGSAGRALPSVSVLLLLSETLPAGRLALFVGNSQFCRDRQVPALS